MLYLFVLLNVSDLILTHQFLSPEIEANPVMRHLWETYGFWSVALVKGLIVIGATFTLYWSIKEGYKIAWYGLVGVIVSLIAVHIMFLIIILGI